ncbi:hypothetical protein, partial [Sideroxydans sp. CL21]
CLKGDGKPARISLRKAGVPMERYEITKKKQAAVRCSVRI